MIMLGVSTGQNITNLIPVIQKNCKKIILLETSSAIRNSWSDGLKKVLENRNVEFESINISGFDIDIEKIKNKLLDYFDNFKEPIYLNIGGGQKPQQIAI